MTSAKIEATAGGPPSTGWPEGTGRPIDWAFYIATVVLGSFLWWGAHYHASSMPAWAPWEFSWPWFIAAALSVWWYARGLYLSAPEERPALWRRIAYFTGVLAIYAVLQTHFEYLAEHMFFLNRVQHVASPDRDLRPIAALGQLLAADEQCLEELDQVSPAGLAWCG